MADLNLKKVFDIKKDVWKKITVYSIDAIQVRTDKGVDRDGSRFPGYSAKYIDRKATRFQRKDGKPTQAKALRGLSLSRRTATPDFKLRGFTMRDLSLIALTDKYALIGWRGEAGNIVAAHEERGKFKVGGITKKQHDEVIDIFDTYFVGKWNQQKDIVIEV